MRHIPRRYLIIFSYPFSRLAVLFLKGNKVECPVCNHRFRKFLPYGIKGRENVLCPNCLSLERHRLLWLYLNQRTPFFTDKLKMLHIAPEQCFLSRFGNLKNLDYTTADLESPLADIKLNVLDMPLPDNSYHVVMCNHVMEHVEDDHKAMTEIFRVLKPGGFAILQVPLDNTLEHTYEDPAITDPWEREKHFLQKDHVRLYGNDYGKRLEKAGFLVTEDDFVKSIEEQLVIRYRLPKNEMVYFCRKG
jgi:SAM-dependent methyltransferase